jgi:hypothetical protein
MGSCGLALGFSAGSVSPAHEMEMEQQYDELEPFGYVGSPGTRGVCKRIIHESRRLRATRWAAPGHLLRGQAPG